MIKSKETRIKGLNKDISRSKTFEWLYVVKNEEEVGSTNCLQIEPVDLNHFFGEDGKIYGYNGLQVLHYVSYSSTKS